MFRKKKENKPPPVPTVGFFRLFRFATPVDVLFMAIGLVGSIVFGIAMPFLSILLGDALTPFLVYEGLRKNDKIPPDSPYFQKTRDEARDGIETTVIKFAVGGVIILLACYILEALWMISGERQTRRLRLLFVSAVLHQDLQWFDKNKAGDITTRLTSDVLIFQEGISEKVSLLLAYVSQFFAGFSIAFYKSPELTGVLLATIPLFLISGVVVGAVIASGTTQSQEAYAKAGAVAQETLLNMKTVSAYNGQDRAFKKFSALLEPVVKVNERKAWISGFSFGVFFGLLYGLFALGFWYGARMVANGEIESGTVLNVLFSVTIGAFSVIGVGPNLQAIAKARGAAVQLFQIVDSKPQITSGNITPDVMKGRLELKNVKFRYPSRPEVEVLKSFSLVIEAGETVALVGSSGSGKSTIVQLLQRFYDCESGEILIDGVSIKDISLRWLREQVSLVSQEPILFDCSIEENVRYGSPDASKVSKESVENCCRMSNAHQFISALPSGYKTMVGERGSMLSGGQKQRIAIARALIKNPKILLLDEASSALDSESEKIVQGALDKASEGRTTIMVAHRLSTVVKANKIVVMQLGEIVEVGTHKELIEIGGVYAGLVKAQELAAAEGRDLIAAIDEVSPVSRNSHLSLDRKNVSPAGSRKSLQSLNKDVPILTKEEKEDLMEKELIKTKKFALMRILKLQRPEVFLLGIGILMSAINGVLLPLFGTITAKLLEVLIKPKDELLEESAIYSLVFVGLMFSNLFSNTFQFGCFGIAAERLTKRVRENMFKALLKQEIAYFDVPENGTGALTGILSEKAERLQGITGPNAANVAQLITAMVASIAIAFYYCWQISLVVLGFIPFIILGNIFEIRIMQGHNSKTRLAYSSAAQTTCDAILNMITVKSFILEEYFMREFAKKIETPYKTGVRSALLSSLGFGYSQGVQFWLYAVAFTAGFFLVFDNYIYSSQMFYSIFTIIFGAIAFGQAAAFGPNVQKAKVAAIYYFELIDRVPSIDASSTEGVTLVDVAGSAEIANGVFSYPQRKEACILKNFSVMALAGKKTALVGPSGSGKSTIVSLLLRFYELDSGAAKVESYNVKEWQLSHLRKQMAIVSQEPSLFSGSIRENIAYGMPDDKDATDENILEAAKLANIHDFIDGLPEKYETSITSSQLSGGQKQRVSIARALIRKPKILLLDEATSALDSESEKAVQAAIEKASEGRTSIVIAHRLSTIQTADNIVVVKDGEIVEQGTHQELLSKNGLYSSLAAKQTL